jgi:bacteriocin biosynthesis cyclodehydratase domain-containing protein
MRESTPRIKRRYSLVAHSPDVVELRYGVFNPTSHTISDETLGGKLSTVLELLNGTMTSKEIAARVQMPRRDIDLIVDHLDALDLLEDQHTSALDHYLDSATWGYSLETGDVARGVLVGTGELVEAIEGYLQGGVANHLGLSTEKDEEALAVLSGHDRSWLFDPLGLEEKLAHFESWSGSFVVFAPDTVNPTVAQAMNRVCLGLTVPWLHMALDGPFLLIGPTVFPGRTACYECFEQRVGMNMRENANYQRYKNALVSQRVRHGRPPTEPCSIGLAAAHAAMEALNYLLTGYTFTVGKVLTIYLPTMEIVFNEILRYPACAACGSTPSRDAAELYFGMDSLVGVSPAE